MSKTLSALTVVVVLGLLAACGGAAAVKANPAPAKPKSTIAAAAAYLHMSRKDLAAELRKGKSLAQIAQAHGRSVAGLKQVLRNAVKARLDAAVKAHKLTAAKEQAALQKLDAKLDQLVQRKGLPTGTLEAIANSAIQQVAGYLGITRHTLLNKLHAGKTLADIAHERGKSLAGLKKKLHDLAKAYLDKMVASGKLKSAKATSLLAKFDGRLDALLKKKLA